MKIAIALLLVSVMLTPVMAGPPINGVYKSIDLSGGTFLPGRYSESWTAASGHLMLGNTTNKYSWDGFTLGTQWWMYCAELSVAPVLTLDTVDTNGDGQQQWYMEYSGGLCILKSTGPWGDEDYTAPYTSYSEIKTLTFASNQLVDVISSVSMGAQFLGFNDACMALSISNQQEHDNTDSAALPANYPGFLDPNTCAPTRTLGSWGEADEFTLYILGCTVPTEERTWGSIKAMFDPNN